MRKIRAVRAAQDSSIDVICLANTVPGRARSVPKLLGIDQLVTLIIAADTFNRSPPGRPFIQIAAVDLWPDNLCEVLKDEEELSQLIERFIIVAKRCAVPVRHE